MKKERFSECHNKQCMWNMGDKKKGGYEYLNNTCYKNTDPINPCESRTQNRLNKSEGED